MPKKGDRIELVSMYNDPNAIAPGTTGIVDSIDGAGQIWVNWDNGRKLAVIPDVDVFNIVG